MSKEVGRQERLGIPRLIIERKAEGYIEESDLFKQVVTRLEADGFTTDKLLYTAHCTPDDQNTPPRKSTHALTLKEWALGIKYHGHERLLGYANQSKEFDSDVPVISVYDSELLVNWDMDADTAYVHRDPARSIADAEVARLDISDWVE